MTGRMAIAAVLMMLWTWSACAVERPLLCVLCEPFDQICTYAIDARGELTLSCPPLSVHAPHDALFIAERHMLIVAAEYKGQPCLIAYAVAADGAMRRVGDPVPTAERNPQLVAWDNGIVAWTRKRVQFFPLVDGTPQPPQRSGPGVDGLVLSAGHAFVLLGAKVASYDLATFTARGALDAGYAPSSMAVDAAGRHLCVLTLDDFDQHIRVFDIGADGALKATALRPKTLREAQKKLVFGPRFAYLLNAGDTISTYDESLAPLGRPMPSSAGLDDLLVNGAFAYTIGTTESAVRPYRVQKDGLLHRLQPAAIPGQAVGTRLVLLGR